MERHEIEPFSSDTLTIEQQREFLKNSILQMETQRFQAWLNAQIARTKEQAEAQRAEYRHLKGQGDILRERLNALKEQAQEG